jgi:hypothetical protein
MLGILDGLQILVVQEQYDLVQIIEVVLPFMELEEDDLGGFLVNIMEMKCCKRDTKEWLS